VIVVVTAVAAGAAVTDGAVANAGDGAVAVVASGAVWVGVGVGLVVVRMVRQLYAGAEAILEGYGYHQHLTHLGPW